MPIRRTALVQYVEWACGRLEFLGLVRRDGRGYAVVRGVRERVLDVSLCFRRREDFNVVHLIARAGDGTESAKIRRILVRMAISYSEAHRGLVPGEASATMPIFRDRVGEFEFVEDQGEVHMRVEALSWKKDVGSFAFVRAGDL